jgi:hypothetical protein
MLLQHQSGQDLSRDATLDLIAHWATCSCPTLQKIFDLAHDFGDAQFFLQDVVGELLWGKVLEIDLAAWVLDVEIAAVLENIGGGDFPGSVVLFALIPPSDAVGELVELDRLGFGVVLPAFGKRLLIVSDLLCRAGTIEEHEIGRNTRVRREDAVGQADDGVEVEVLQ